MPHAAGQLSLWASATELTVPRACAPRREKPPQWEAQVPQPENMQQRRPSEATHKQYENTYRKTTNHSKMTYLFAY